MIETPGVNEIEAAAVFVVSARLVAVTAILWALAIVLGAVYKPAVEMDPTAGLRDHDTPVLVEPDTEATNCLFWEAVKLTLPGDIVIDTAGVVEDCPTTQVPACCNTVVPLLATK